MKTSLPALSQELLFQPLPVCPVKALLHMLRPLAQMLYPESNQTFSTSRQTINIPRPTVLAQRIFITRPLVSPSNTACACTKQTDTQPFVFSSSVFLCRGLMLDTQYPLIHSAFPKLSHENIIKTVHTKGRLLPGKANSL